MTIYHLRLLGSISEQGTLRQPNFVGTMVTKNVIIVRGSSTHLRNSPEQWRAFVEHSLLSQGIEWDGEVSVIYSERGREGFQKQLWRGFV